MFSKPPQRPSSTVNGEQGDHVSGQRSTLTARGPFQPSIMELQKSPIFWSHWAAEGKLMFTEPSGYLLPHLRSFSIPMATTAAIAHLE